MESKCTDAHGDKELSEWNQHLERMEKEMDHQRKEKNVKNDNTTAKTKTNVFARENLQAPKYEVRCYVMRTLIEKLKKGLFPVGMK